MFRIKIKENIDIVALIAIFLSVGSVVYNVIGALEGADIQSYPPERISIFKETLGGTDYVAFVVPMTYTNKGRAGYNGVLKREVIRFNIGGKQYLHHWHEFVNTSIDQKGYPIKEKKEDAQPFVITAGNVVGHETLFFPRSTEPKGTQKDNKWENFLKWDDFCAALAHDQEFKIEVVSEVDGRQNILTHSRRIYVDDDLRERLKRYGGAGASCWKTD
jgi:hypothetical protein